MVYFNEGGRLLHRNFADMPAMRGCDLTFVTFRHCFLAAAPRARGNILPPNYRALCQFDDVARRH
jgi:hypothetical protein